MKTRIAPAIALAAAVALGTSGCGLIVPQATTYEYSPSDGIDVTLPDISLRNFLLLTTDETDETNPVFTSVNNGAESTTVGFTFINDAGTATQFSYDIEPGLTPHGLTDPEFVEIPGLQPGSMVTVYVENGGVEEEHQIPVLDGTLEEYAGITP